MVPPADPRVQETLGFMAANAGKPLKLPELARRVRLRPDTLSRKLHALTGESFRALLLGMRMRRAETLLAETWLDIKEVAVGAGFASGSALPDRSHFVRRFTALHGMSPIEYRRRIHAAAPVSASGVTPKAAG